MHPNEIKETLKSSSIQFKPNKNKFKDNLTSSTISDNINTNFIDIDKKLKQSMEFDVLYLEKNIKQFSTHKNSDETSYQSIKHNDLRKDLIDRLYKDKNRSFIYDKSLNKINFNRLS